MSIERLRLATRQDHQRLEDRLDIQTQCATLPSYRLLLERFYGFYCPYESLLRASSALLPQSIHWSSRMRLPSLISDLKQLGVSDIQIDRLSQYRDLPLPETRAEALGCLYVTEGSTLGGQIIRRMIQERYRNDTPPTAFFDGYGAQTGKRWRELCLAIDGADFTDAEEDAMSRSACGIFHALETWLCNTTSDTVN